jgi:hypothetical protein
LASSAIPLVFVVFRLLKQAFLCFLLVQLHQTFEEVQVLIDLTFSARMEEFS